MVTLQTFLAALGGFINNILIPVLFGIAFLFFLINTFRYFILGGANEQSRDKAKRNALYGLGAFVFLLVLWGLVGILLSGLGLGQDRPLCSDYMNNSGVDCIEESGNLDANNSFPPNGMF